MTPEQEGDLICDGVLRLVQALTSPPCRHDDGPSYDRVLRSPAHDMAVYGRLIPSKEQP